MCTPQLCWLLNLGQSLLNTWCLFVILLGATPKHITVKYRCLIKIWNWIGHIYLRLPLLFSSQTSTSHTIWHIVVYYFKMLFRTIICSWDCIPSKLTYLRVLKRIIKTHEQGRKSLPHFFGHVIKPHDLMVILLMLSSVVSNNQHKVVATEEMDVVPKW